MHSANYSLGIAVFRKILEQFAPALRDGFDVELVEKHHNQKVDAPSGTAKLLVSAIDPKKELRIITGREGMCGPRKKDEIGVFALRGGTVAGEHTVYFFGEEETLCIAHTAASRRVFAVGAVRAAEAVSYTHLDVYKRQTWLWLRKSKKLSAAELRNMRKRRVQNTTRAVQASGQFPAISLFPAQRRTS